MTLKQKYYDAYYKNFNELIDNISVIKPNDSSLSLFKIGANTMVQVSGHNVLVDNINDVVKNYSDKILKRDESFFLNELSNEFSGISFIINEINKIKEIWLDPETSNANKEIIWKHFIIFAKLSKFI